MSKKHEQLLLNVSVIMIVGFAAMRLIAYGLQITSDLQLIAIAALVMGVMGIFVLWAMGRTAKTNAMGNKTKTFTIPRIVIGVQIVFNQAPTNRMTWAM